MVECDCSRSFSLSIRLTLIQHSGKISRDGYGRGRGVCDVNGRVARTCSRSAHIAPQVPADASGFYLLVLMSVCSPEAQVVQPDHDEYTRRKHHPFEISRHGVRCRSST